MKKVRWIIFGMLVALLTGCSGKKAAETSADAKNVKNTLDFVDAHGECYTVEINEAVAKNPYDNALFAKTENKISYSRQFYNDIVTRYNTKLDVIPTNIVAGMYPSKFKPAELFKVEEEEARKNVKVSF